MIKRKIFFIYLKTIKLIRSLFGYLFHQMNNIILYLFKGSYAEVRGYKMFLDLNDTNEILSNLQEEYSLDILKEHINKGDIVIDIGACIGIYTLEMAKLVGGNGRVIAFEPLKEAFYLLKKNIEINNYEGRVKIQQKGLLDKVGKATLFYHPYHIGASKLVDDLECREKRETETISLDEFFKNNHSKISFIKMDADGSEYLILQGASEVLKRTNKMLVEFVPGNIQVQGITPKEYLDLIKSYGFKIYSVNDKERKLESGELDYLMSLFKNKKKSGLAGYVNLLCVKDKKINGR